MSPKLPVNISTWLRFDAFVGLTFYLKQGISDSIYDISVQPGTGVGVGLKILDALASWRLGCG